MSNFKTRLTARDQAVIKALYSFSRNCFLGEDQRSKLISQLRIGACDGEMGVHIR